MACNPNNPNTTESASRLGDIRGRKIITLDVDGTTIDRWGCDCDHGGRRGGDATVIDGTLVCCHERADVLAQVLDLVATHDALIVVLSWRAGMVDNTIRYFEEHLGTQWPIDIAAYVIPGSPDDPRPLNDKAFGHGQVGFKAGSITYLRTIYNCEVIASFEDNADVCEHFRNLGVPRVHHVPRKVKILPHEWRAGYLGAPRTATASRTGKANSDHNAASYAQTGIYGLANEFDPDDQDFSYDEPYDGQYTLDTHPAFGNTRWDDDEERF